ncbi:(Fe-S)-binding protein [Belnapia sp. T6]|uniref:(Fe-S)-binding protein n=1 Tax=Belnapia mucosa TaxID=2804532 RepID=A0ABS1V3L5_9PROT|nr:heterodisulfide reductase-related iron-sulfur binding cluster [Belnapia mucosa]MBL6456177.1 (Fe-S)-binding protein [Belnapia mucosa]
MAVAGAGDRAVFWYGCNMTRHGEVIRATARLLEAVGIDAVTTGGPGSCCGSPKDANARINEGMARRTIQQFNATGRPVVATWCPSCHMNMQDSMAPVTPTNFETVHVTELLHSRQDRLRPLLARPVRARVLLHAHLGFNTRVPVNGLVSDLLRLVPGLELVEHPIRVPGHMCSSLAAVPGALADAEAATLAAMAETGADTLCTIFHSCHRELVALERGRPLRVLNWVHLLAESAGWAAEDGYKAMRNAEDPRAALGEARIEAAGDVAFARLVEPELRKPPTL